MEFNETICALATPKGIGAIAIIRISGEKSIEIIDEIFQSKNKKKKLIDVKSHTIHFGIIFDEGKIIDEVLVSIFKAPNSYTSENSIEISCHASPYIQQEILNLIQKKGARIANPGEFTFRAFLNGKLDLIQAESVADLIASNSKSSHQIAMNQMKGNFSNDLKELREKLINFTALIELELDFSEEDVEFADRTEFKKLLNELKTKIQPLIKSFELGNVLKNGVPVAIIGRPNAGKSTLLNALLNEERAIVSSIAGTTRDTIEEILNLDGILFRFIDTAGIRSTSDEIESLGIEKSFKKASQAEIIIYLFDSKITSFNQVLDDLKQLSNLNSHLFICQNKIDILEEKPFNYESIKNYFFGINFLSISAKNKIHLQDLEKLLVEKTLKNSNLEKDTIVTNSRHLEALKEIDENINLVLNNLETGISGDFISFDLKNILNYIGKITGEVDIDRDILGTIFGKFCIGK